MVRFKYITILILSFLLYKATYSQNITRLINIQSGTAVDFYFQTYDHFDSGRELNNHTVLTVYYNDSTDLGAPSPTPAGWSLKVKASDSFLNSFYGTTTLPNATITLEATDAYANTTLINLTDGYQEIATWNASMDILDSYENITISYTCGQNTNLTDSIDNVYRNLLIFKVE